MTRSRYALTVLSTLIVAAIGSVSAHPVRGLLHPALAKAFASSPSAGTDAPIPIAWGEEQAELSVACFYVANSSDPRSDDLDWPRITAVGIELPGRLSGFSLVEPIDGDWELVEGIAAALPGHGSVTIDVALVARVNRAGWFRRGPLAPLGIPPGQEERRGSGTRFCLSGPFPPGLTIEQILNGVVVRFHRVEPHGPSIDVGVWDDARRTFPQYPE